MILQVVLFGIGSRSAGLIVTSAPLLAGSAPATWLAPDSTGLRRTPALSSPAGTLSSWRT